MEIFLIVLALVCIFSAIAFDFKTREIPNWISFALIIFALAYRAFVSILGWTDFFTPGLIGLAIFWCVGEIMCRTGFGGGDSKLLAALGAVIPFSQSFSTNLFILVFFFFSLMILGAGYSLIYSIVIVLYSPRNFWKKLKKEIKLERKIFFFAFIAIIASLFLIFYHLVFLALTIFFILLPMIFVYAKAVEEMLVKEISTSKLVPGDWIYEKVKVGNKTITPKITGLNEKQIKLLKKHKKKIKVKDGVPFTPSFLLAIILLIYLWYSNRGFFNYNLWF